VNFDILVRGGSVMVGDEPAFRGDVGVEGERIAAVAPDLSTSTAVWVIEADGLVTCPGFIDMHAHSALEPFRDPRLVPKIAQGFTTELINPDGLAPAPVSKNAVEERRSYLKALEGVGPDRWGWSTFADYLEALDEARPATTLVPSIGHNAVRDRVLGAARRPPTLPELREMQRQVRLGFENGARALSFGLIYLPGVFADTDELAALGQEAGRFGGLLVPHVRNEGEQVLDAVAEMVDVARRSGAPLHISHLKVIGNAHLVEPLLELIDETARNTDITFDQYPYGAGSTVLSALLPPWALEGGARSILARLTDPEERQTIIRDMEAGLPGWENLSRACGPERIRVAHAGPERKDDVGKTLAELGENRGCSPTEATIELLQDTSLDAAMVDHYATEETVKTIFRHPRALVGSDGIFGARPHPRLYGTAARVLGRYALREHIIDVDEAVARLTARAADRLRLADRGRVREGLRADLVIFDPTSLTDTATYDEPISPPAGIRCVLVAGEAVWADGQPTGALPGEVLRDPLPER
jgi:N-acyl-D-amino-acid deacylase